MQINQDTTTRLTPDLLEDLLNPALSPITICQTHNLTLSQLDTLTSSEHYRRTLAQIHGIHSARREAIDEELRTQSLAALRDIVTDSTHLAEQHPKRAATLLETRRKAITTILRVTAPAVVHSSPTKRATHAQPVQQPSHHPHRLAADPHRALLPADLWPHRHHQLPEVHPHRIQPHRPDRDHHAPARAQPTLRDLPPAHRLAHHREPPKPKAPRRSTDHHHRTPSTNPPEVEAVDWIMQTNIFGLTDRRHAIRRFTAPPSGQITLEVSGLENETVFYLGRTSTSFLDDALPAFTAWAIASLLLVVAAAVLILRRLTTTTKLDLNPIER